MRIKIVVLLVISGLIIMGGFSNVSAKPIRLILTTVQLDNQQMGKAGQQLKELIDEKLKGKVDVKLYTGAQLYSGVEELEAIKKGDVQMTFAIGSIMGSLAPSMSIFKLPFLFTNVETAYKVLDGPNGKKIFEDVRKQGIDVLGGFSSGNIFVSNSSRPLKVPNDFKGLKMRTSGKMEASILEELGAISTVLPSEETYSGLQQKVIDGLATPSTVFYARKYHEVQKYLTNAGMLYWSNGFLLVNSKFWEGLPEDVRNILSSCVETVLKDVREQNENALSVILKNIADSGVEVHNVTPDEIKMWREAALPVYEKYKEKIGAQLVDDVMKEVEKLN